MQASSTVFQSQTGLLCHFHHILLECFTGSQNLFPYIPYYISRCDLKKKKTLSGNFTQKLHRSPLLLLKVCGPEEGVLRCFLWASMNPLARKQHQSKVSFSQCFHIHSRDCGTEACTLKHPKQCPLKLFAVFK